MLTALAIIAATFAPVSCATVDPVANVIIMNRVESPVLHLDEPIAAEAIVLYWDRGDHIVTDEDVPQYALDLVTEQTGTDLRTGCGFETDYATED